VSCETSKRIFELVYRFPNSTARSAEAWTASITIPRNPARSITWKRTILKSGKRIGWKSEGGGPHFGLTSFWTTDSFSIPSFWNHQLFLTVNTNQSRSFSLEFRDLHDYLKYTLVIEHRVYWIGFKARNT
jgi:hypothetical protein